MKKDGFVKLLRRIIREEVRNVVRAELKPILNEVKINKHDINLHEVMDTPNVPRRPVAKKKFTKDAMLNDILNETANTPSPQGQTDWSTMNFRSEMAESFGMERPNAPLASSGINGEPINMSNEGVATAVNAMTKDYSALMKAIDKKKNR